MKSSLHNHAGPYPTRPTKEKKENFKWYFLLSKLGIVMKLVTILLTICCLQASAFADAQVTISIKDAPLEKVFSLIKKQTGFLILYNQKDLAGAKNVTLDLKNATLQETLDACIAGQNLKFSIEGKSVFISKKQPKLDQSWNDLFPDSLINVQGKVTDVKNSAIAGATISIKGSEIATSTNVDGFFSINGVKKNAILLITSIGFEDKLVRVGNRSRISIQLNVSAQSMQEITVYNTGFQKIPKERATGSFVNIDNELINRTTSINIIDRLENITNSLLIDRRVDQNGNPKNNLQIRGLFTLTEQISQPLIILDNFPYNGNLNNINPNDIESVTVLRDAAAASIWGAKAGNGVIVLTSKKGRFDQPLRVTVSANTTITGKPQLYRLPILGANEWVDIERNYYERGAYDADINGFFKPPLSPVVEILEKVKAGQLTSVQGDAAINALRSQDVRDDFLNHIYRPCSTSQQYALSITGGGKGNSYIFSLGYDKLKSELRGNNNDRISLRLANTFAPIKGLEIQTSIGYTTGKVLNNSFGPFQYSEYNPSRTLTLPIYSKLIDENGNSLPIAKEYRSSYIDTVGGGQLLDWRFIPLDELNGKKDQTKSQAFLAALGINYKLTSFLAFDLQYQYQKNNNTQTILRTAESFYTRNLINLFTNLQSDNSSIRNPLPKGDILDEFNEIMDAHSFRGTANFDYSLKGGHKVVALAGFSVDQQSRVGNSDRKYGLDNNLNTINVDLVNRYPTMLGYSLNIFPGPIGFSDKMDRFVSMFANASYTYNSKYTLSASGRRDASNLFGVETNNKWKPLWSIGAAWNVSNEDFYKASWLTFLNLRTTYGYAGNVNNSLSSYNILIHLPAVYNAPINLPYANVQSLANPKLSWEQVNTLNFGIDFAFSNHRVSGSIEYYNKRSVNVIAPKPVDITSGYGSIQTNSADMKGKGIDVKLNFKPVVNPIIKWDAVLNFSYASYKVTKILQPYNTENGYQSNGVLLQAVEGYTPYLLVSYKWAGLDPDNGDPRGILNGKISKNYDSLVYFSPFKDQVIHGSGIPEYFGNLLNSITWKNFTLSANITYKLKYYFQRKTINYGALVAGNTHTDYLKRWQKTGDEYHTNVPSFEYPARPTRNLFYQNSEANIYKGDHIRLEDIRVSYSFSKIGKKYFKELGLFGYMGNLNILLWKANKAEIDPNFPNGNMTAKSYTLGVRMGF